MLLGVLVACLDLPGNLPEILWSCLQHLQDLQACGIRECIQIFREVIIELGIIFRHHSLIHQILVLHSITPFPHPCQMSV